MILVTSLICAPCSLHHYQLRLAVGYVLISLTRPNGLDFGALTNSRVLFPLLPSEQFLEAVFVVNSISITIVMWPDTTSWYD